MRIIIEVKTVGESIEGIRKLAIEGIDKAINQRMQRCVECNEPFLAERRTRKKYCGILCRWEASGRAKLVRNRQRKQADGTIEGGKVMSTALPQPEPIVSTLPRNERSEVERQLARDRMAKVRAARKQDAKF